MNGTDRRYKKVSGREAEVGVTRKMQRGTFLLKQFGTIALIQLAS